MSASTVAIAAANQGAVNTNNPSLALSGARRRSVAITEKKSSNIEMVAEGGGGHGVSDPTSGEGGGRDLSHTIRGETALDRHRDFSSLQAKKGGLTNSTVSPRRRKVVPKPPSTEKPLWQTVLSVFTKNFLLLIVLLGLVQMIKRLALKSDGDGAVATVGITEFEGRIAEVEAFLKKTTKMMQVQVEVMDRKIVNELEVMDKKIESEVGGLRSEFNEKGTTFENALKKLETKTDDLDKSLGELRASSFFTKEDFDRFSDELKKSNPEGRNDKDWSLDEIRAVAKEIVEKEIEKHAADGLGRVDYAMHSGGGMVVEHSEPYSHVRGNWFASLGKNQVAVHAEAQKILLPSFGEPGQCFPFRGSNGYAVIRLRTAIIPDGVTLEHVAKSVAYDRSSAPKDCRISGWFQPSDPAKAGQTRNFFKLAEFVYDLDRSSAQTFNVNPADSGIINTVRFDFRSNYGAPHTCVYRLRVHGREPDVVAISNMMGL